MPKNNLKITNTKNMPVKESQDDTDLVKVLETIAEKMSMGNGEWDGTWAK